MINPGIPLPTNRRLEVLGAKLEEVRQGACKRRGAARHLEFRHDINRVSCMDSCIMNQPSSVGSWHERMKLSQSLRANKQ